MQSIISTAQHFAAACQPGAGGLNILPTWYEYLPGDNATGISYVLSQGEPERAKKARGTILNSLIGLAIAIFSTAIVNFIGNTLIK